MTRLKILQDFMPHWNKFKTFNIWSVNNPEQDNGNALGYSAHYYSILYRNNLLEESDRDKLRKVAYTYFKEPGLLFRFPNKDDYQAFDDYEFFCHAAHLCGVTEIPEQIYQYGRFKLSRFWRFWYFNNHPDKTFRLKNFFGRRPGFVTHIKLTANRYINIFDRLYWSIGLMSNAHDEYGSTSGKVRRFMMIMNYEKYKKDNNFSCFIMNFAVSYWRKRMKNMYPKGQMGEVMSIYFRQIPWIREYYDGII